MYYQELTLIPDPEIPINILWERLYPQIHIGLADVYNQHGINSIGISFPRYQMSLQMPHNTLGNKLRLFAPDEATFQLLDIEKWLERLSDYAHIKKIAEVPEHCQFVTVKRYRFKPLEQQAEDFAKRWGVGKKEALEHCLKFRQPEAFPPFIKMYSQSTGQPYPLVIQQTQAKTAKNGSYNTYGFGKEGSTVPHW